MDKMFKRSILGAAVAAVAAMGSAAPVMANENVEIYGQAAISFWVIDNKEGDTTTDVDNESRLGVRGSKDFKNGPTFIWQMESGNVGDKGDDGSFGVRDTFAGFEFDAGKLRFGRVLTPLYEVVDWPYANPGLGTVWDGNTDIAAGANLDRQNDQFRWDSKNYNGFSYDISVGHQGDNTSDEIFYSAAVHYTAGIFTGHLAYQLDNGIQDSEKDVAKKKFLGSADRTSLLAGAELHFENGFSLMGAVRSMQSDYDTTQTLNGLAGVNDEDQLAYSLIGQYVTGDWLFKLAYAGTTELDSNKGETKETEDQAITARVLYNIDPSAVVYTDIRSYDMNGNTKDKDLTRWGVGVEYYF